MRAVAKICEHEEASTHLIFESNSSKGQILRALLNSVEPFDTPINVMFDATLVAVAVVVW